MMKIWKLVFVQVMLCSTIVFAQTQDDLIRKMENKTGGSIKYSRQKATGKVDFIRFSGQRLKLNGNTLAEKSEQFFNQYGSLFGVSDQRKQLELTRERRDALGFTHRYYKQVHEGVEVFAAQMRLHYDRNGEMTAANGTIVPDIDVSPTLKLSASECGKIARQTVRKQKRVPISSVSVLQNRLCIFREGLVRGVEGEVYLAYEVLVGNTSTIREFVYVDANSGKIIDRISDIHTDISREVYNSQSGNLLWKDGNTYPYNSGSDELNTEVNNVIDYSEDIYNVYKNISGGTYLSYDGEDATMVNMIYSIELNCPNAAWTGSYVTFCESMTGNDVVAHEWTHAYGDYMHDLIYQWQPGALDEAFSDIFAEITDLVKNSGAGSQYGVRTDGVCSTLMGFYSNGLEITAPPSIAGSFDVNEKTIYSPQSEISVSGTVEMIDDGDESDDGTTTDGCQAFIGFTPGNIALIDRGTCTFVTKVLNAQEAGAVGVIIANYEDGLINMSGTSTSITIPSVMVTQTDGDIIKGKLGEGVQATITQSITGDEESYRWLVNENTATGVLRDLSSPNCLDLPAKVNDDYYVCSSDDNGGVHTNCTVPSHAFALLVDGGVFNGYSISGIGLDKAAHIYWRAMSEYQTNTTDFSDHADILETCCSDLIGVDLTGVADGLSTGDPITQSHCDELAKAIAAVELRTWPDFCGFDRILDPDVTSVEGTEVFSESFDTPPGGWAFTNYGVTPEYIPRNWEWTDSTVGNAPGGGALFADDAVDIGDCADDDQSRVLRADTPQIIIPNTQKVVLEFYHYVATEKEYDGGNLKISVDGVNFQEVTLSSFLVNPYNLELADETADNTNPNGGEWAFSGTDEGTVDGSWGISQVDLKDYAAAGQSVVIRFEFSADGCNGNTGWYIDNVRVVGFEIVKGDINKDSIFDIKDVIIALKYLIRDNLDAAESLYMEAEPISDGVLNMMDIVWMLQALDNLRAE